MTDAQKIWLLEWIIKEYKDSPFTADELAYDIYRELDLEQSIDTHIISRFLQSLCSRGIIMAGNRWNFDGWMIYKLGA